MAGNNLSIDGELRYIIQWFAEWSELQREDFLPIVVEYLTKDRSTHYMNGVVNSMAAASFDEKPMSLFQCRVSVTSDFTDIFLYEIYIDHFFLLLALLG